MARNRRRTRKLNFDRQEIFDRVDKFFERDHRAKSRSRDARLQRYAKYRLWTEGKDFPWPNASDIALSDMTEQSLRMQDTLVNSVLSTRPAITPMALREEDRDLEEDIAEVIDYQVFAEQRGEDCVAQLAEAYCNNPSANVFVPWVREFREVPEIREYGPIPDEMEPFDYFAQIIRVEFPDASATPLTEAGWDWEVFTDREFKLSFYTEGDKVQAVWKERVTVHDGPSVRVIPFDDILYPERSANLQPPSPANPNGASHVIIRDRPTIDEVRRLQKSGFYDLLTDEEAKDLLEQYQVSGLHDQVEEQKDAFAGSDTFDREDQAKSHNRITRLTVFDRFDIDGDGIDEDVIWWVLWEPKLVVKAKLMGEMYPLRPPRRPLAGGSFLPVEGRHNGMDLLELVEGMHDATKILLDQGIDSGTLANSSPGFYRPTSNVKAETIGLEPGLLYPVGDPSRDIAFPTIGNPQAVGLNINLITLLRQYQERLTVIGDAQFGRVPAGRSSALRTEGGVAFFAGQGEARPERILRRFFGILTEVWGIIYDLDRAFLSERKEYRVSSVKSSDESPFRTIERDDLDGMFRFTFHANVLNTSRQAMQESLAELMGLYLNPLLIQLGIVQPDGAYRLLRDFGKSKGQDPDQYLSPPSPQAQGPTITWEEAVQAILSGVLPRGAPEEGAQAHLEGLLGWMQSDMPQAVEEGVLDAREQSMLESYAEQITEMAQAEAQQMAMQQAFAQAGAQFNQGQPGAPPTSGPPNMGNPQVSSGAELLDETLPSAGGGAIQ